MGVGPFKLLVVLLKLDGFDSELWKLNVVKLQLDCFDIVLGLTSVAAPINTVVLCDPTDS